MGEFEMIDGKRIPMRYWKMNLSSKELALITLSIAESIIMNTEKPSCDLKILEEKVKLSNKIFKIFKVKQFDKEIVRKLEYIAQMGTK